MIEKLDEEQTELSDENHMILIERVEDGFIEKHNYPESMPYRNKNANDMNSFFWGLIMLGGMFILCLLSWVYSCFVAIK